MVTEGRKYRVLGTIGRGGFGTVYQGELLGEGGFSKVVAMKVLNPEMSGVEEVARRLRDEARVLGLVRHRAIVQVDGLVRLGGRWAIVMEWIDGVDLKRLVAKGPIPPGPALEIATEVASALRVAWEQPGPDGVPLNLLHRDVKPSNIQITAHGEVKLLDFGTARANFASREARTVMVSFGTPDYMSPERLEFSDVPAGDVYALGVVLWEMITGAHLGHTSARPDRHAELCAHAEEKLTGADEALGSLILSMLAYAPEVRPTVAEVERRLRALRAACPGVWLAEWSAEAVPPLRRTPTSDDDEMVGRVLEEGTETGPVQRTWGPEPLAPAAPAPPPPAEAPGDTRAALRQVAEAAGVPEPAVAQEPTQLTAAEPEPEPPAEARGAGGGRRETHATRATGGTTPEAPGTPGGEPAPRGRARGWIGVGVGLVVLVGIGLGVWALLGRGADEPSPAVAAGSVATPQPAPAPDAAEPAAADPAAAEPAPPTVASAGSEAPVAATSPARPAAPPKAAKAPRAPKPAKGAAPAADRGRVVVSGDAEKVELVGGGRRWTAGEVPAGTYTLEATFPGRGAVQGGRVTVTAGATTRVVCKRTFARCDVIVP